MKMIIAVALALVAVAVAAPVEEQEVQVLNNEFEILHDGFHSNLKASNGIEQEATGRLQEAQNEEGKTVQVVVIKGHYSQLGENGESQVIEYIADQDGYHARGPQIPVNNPDN